MSSSPEEIALRQQCVAAAPRWSVLGGGCRVTVAARREGNGFSASMCRATNAAAISMPSASSARTKIVAAVGGGSSATGWHDHALRLWQLVDFERWHRLYLDRVGIPVPFSTPAVPLAAAIQMR